MPRSRPIRCQTPKQQLGKNVFKPREKFQEKNRKKYFAYFLCTEVWVVARGGIHVVSACDLVKNCFFAIVL